MMIIDVEHNHDYKTLRLFHTMTLLELMSCFCASIGLMMIPVLQLHLEMSVCDDDSSVGNVLGRIDSSWIDELVFFGELMLLLLR